jgi:hypothetical protein
MLSNRGRRWYVSVLGVMTLALLVTGGVVAAQFRAFASPESVDSALRTSEMVRVADIASADGAAARGVFVQRTPNGLFCLTDAQSAGGVSRGGGCNAAADPLGGKSLFISFAYEGGPAVADVKDARLIGLSSLEVSAVEVLMDDGSRRTMRLREARIGADTYRAFGYRFRKADLRRGVSPASVIALDDAGQEIDRQPTGFGG